MVKIACNLDGSHGYFDMISIITVVLVQTDDKRDSTTREGMVVSLPEHECADAGAMYPAHGTRCTTNVTRYTKHVKKATVE